MITYLRLARDQRTNVTKVTKGDTSLISRRPPAKAPVPEPERSQPARPRLPVNCLEFPGRLAQPAARRAGGIVILAIATINTTPATKKGNSMIDVRLTPARIPPEPNWTSEKDREYVDNLLGDGYEFEDLLLRCFDSLREMSATLRKALDYFGEAPRADANVLELIYYVEKQFREHPRSKNYLDRFVDHLNVCRFVFNEFERVIGIYEADPDLNWLGPLADLGDWLVSATSWLEEGLVCEHQDFESPMDNAFQAAGRDKSLPR
jgi:hypothetical protein